MLGRLFLLFLVVPVLDLALLVHLGGRLGFLPTVALVVSTAAAGAWLARREGAGAWRRVRDRLAAGALPGPELLDALVVLVAGVLLVAPGFLTDAAGLLGLFPPTRVVVRRWLQRRWSGTLASGRVASPFGTTPFGTAGGGWGGAPSGAPQPPAEDAEVVEETRARGHNVARARL